MSRYYIEFEKWKNLSRAEQIRQATLAYREERLGVDQMQMVSPYPLSRRKDGSLNYQPDEKAKFAKEENEASRNIFELIEDGCNIVFWFSPKGGDYPDGRLIIAVPDKIDGGDVYLNCRGMPLHWDPDKMMAAAEKIIDGGGMVMDPLYSSESLRSQPIGVKYEGDWTEFCEKTLGMEKLWEYIRFEKDLAEVGDLEKVVERAYIQANGNSVMFEKIMYGWGFRLNPLGNHGGSHLGMDFGSFGFGNRFNLIDDFAGLPMGFGGGIESFKMMKQNNEISVEKVKRGDSYYCPLCGEEIGEGVTVCRKCQVGIK